MSVKHDARSYLIPKAPPHSMGWDCAVTHMDYGERFRKHRRWIQDSFSSKRVLINYRPLQMREVYTLLNGFVEVPSAFSAHIRR